MARTNISLSMSGILPILAGLRSLDGYSKTIKDASGERSVQVPYSFAGLTRLHLAENLAEIEDVARGFQKVRDDLWREYAGPLGELPDTEEGRAKAKEYDSEMRPVYDAVRDLKLWKIPYTELRLDDNPIAGSVLAAIMPIIEMPG